MKYLFTTFRLMLGAVFFAFGWSKFIPFIPTPPVPPEASMFIGALVATGYLWSLIGVIEITAGALLLANRLIPLALLLLAPIVTNIVLYLVLLAQNPMAYGMSVFLLTAGITLATQHWNRFAPIFQMRREA
ncbi:DoxX family membrane protein [Leptonema illini]|jgi:uncharacterized membrane protein YphA (DoxX/SURF4 family)|uniref:DoxX family protein n=1 Tax=Leptonema illini DSM 21528 TaxID=929563 RepID=H2CBK1_9LEPT|nr:DoxX family membrane protein [Leptonema illini]EHQ07376.1 hypothetical protein Lepil_2705 [Leptonema illini DSM 21528]